MNDTKSFLKKYYSYSPLLLFFISLFFGGKIVVLSLVLVVVSIIFSMVKNGFKFKKNIPLLLLIGFYIWHLIGYFYSINKGVASFDLEVKMSIILFPLLFIGIKESFLDKTLLLSKLFVFSTFIAGIVLLYFSLIHRFETGYMLYYMDYSRFLHPSYITLYLDFGIILSIYLISKTKSFLSISLILLSIILSLINIYFIDSKSGYIVTAVMILFSVLFFSYSKSKLITISGLVVMVLISFFVLKNNYRFQTTYVALTNYKSAFDNPESVSSSTGMRLLAWDAAIDIIEKNAIFGVGAGDIKDDLIDVYKKKNYTHLEEFKLNVHNQFLETWLGQGFIGFVLLLLVFIVPFIDAIKHKNFILQGFLLIVFINFMFESMLNVQAGTVFFGFFYSFLVVLDRDE